MRFESVTAHGFGPFNNRTIELAPRMTLIYGANESGKSTWHAALYAALCGSEKGQTREHKEFSEQYRPWDRPDEWRVSVVVRLDDGRPVEVAQNFLNRALSRAGDAEFGRDYSQEIASEGMPDGSRWLGLNRQSFRAVACVRQAEILRLQDDAEMLQTDLQRAAATAGTDSTAAAAIQRLDEFRKENVGSERAPTKPLMTAKQERQHAGENLDRAKQQHGDYQRLLAEYQQRKAAADLAAGQRKLLGAAVAAHRARRTRTDLKRANELVTKFPQGEPPAAQVDEELARQVAVVLRAWQERPDIPELTGDWAEHIRSELDRLPVPPEGDCEPAGEVTDAWNDLDLKRRLLRHHEANRPPQPRLPNTGDATEQELRELASILKLPAPSTDLFTAAVLGGVAAILLIASFLLQSKLCLGGGLVLLVSAAVALVVGLLRRTYGVWARGQQTARARVARFGLDADPHGLESLADQLAAATKAQASYSQWQEDFQKRERDRDTARETLLSRLRDRGVSTNDPNVAMDEYRLACKSRGEQAREAARRPHLERELVGRSALEQQATEAQDRRTAAEEDLRRVAGQCGVSGADDAELAQGLGAWIAERDRALAQRNRAIQEWADLQALLQERTLDDLERETDRLELAAREACAAFSNDLVEEAIRGIDPTTVEAQLAGLRDVEAEQAKQLTGSETTLADRETALPSVAEAEERLKIAEAELERLGQLDDILASTIQLLKRAQETVHRTIAPRLTQSVKRWLPQVTAGRYHDVRVDPESLDVQVCGAGNQWRRASRLSHGTAEQIYLFLRAALAEHLAKPGESCPLLLDEVTVHSDAERTAAILQALRVVSEQRQVILFSQQPEVLQWAEANLREPEARIVRLDPTQIPA